MGLTKTIKNIQKVISDTSAKVTLEWPDGTRVFISRHVYAVRLPAKPRMIPADDAKLYTLDGVDEMTPEDWNVLQHKYDALRKQRKDREFKGIDDAIHSRDKIQEDYKPWIKSDKPG